jgi:hypothetical protein
VPGIAPWVSVEPNTNGAAILGVLPFRQGSVTFRIPRTVVPAGATGILVFAWAILTGENERLAYWHFVSRAGVRRQNWFSMLIAGDPTGRSTTGNSQAFWLPMPSDRSLTVTLFKNDLTSPMNQGEVEIHGYYPGPTRRDRSARR